MGKGLYMSPQLAPRAASSSDQCLEFAHIGREQREDSIRFPKVGMLEDNGLGLVNLWCGHLT